MENIIKIENLVNKVEDKNILNGLNLEINKGEIHVIMGPNGGGKSTLASTLAGDPSYFVVDGQVTYQGEDLVAMKVEERAKKGIFLAFQTPEEVEGVTVKNFIKTAKVQKDGVPVKIFKFQEDLQKTLDILNFDKSYSDRYLNVGFSGGEKKKNEILQMLMLNPKLSILDEIDSGLDVDAIRIVGNAIKQYHNNENAILIITHNSKLLEILKPNYVHVLVKGKIVQTGGYELIKDIEENGFDGYRK